MVINLEVDLAIVFQADFRLILNLNTALGSQSSLTFKVDFGVVFQGGCILTGSGLGSSKMSLISDELILVVSR